MKYTYESLCSTLRHPIHLARRTPDRRKCPTKGPTRHQPLQQLLIRAGHLQTPSPATRRRQKRRGLPLPTRPPRHPTRTHHPQRPNRLVGALPRLRQRTQTRQSRNQQPAALSGPVLRRRERTTLQPPSLLQSQHRPLPDPRPDQTGRWTEQLPVRAQPYGVGGSVGVECTMSRRERRSDL